MSRTGSSEQFETGRRGKVGYTGEDLFNGLENRIIVKTLLIRLASLIWGLFLFALGIVLTMKANIGFAPWDVLHSGLSERTGISFGTVSILIGLLICVLVLLLGEKLGLGTLLNMVLIGSFIDILLKADIIPEAQGFISGLAVITLGLFVIAFGSYFYIKAGFGAGPRDYLMIVIRRRTRLSVGLSRGLVEGTAVLFGWLLGGPVGGGTVLAAFGISICIQIVFSLLKFEPAAVQHETLTLTWQRLRQAVASDS